MYFSTIINYCVYNYNLIVLSKRLHVWDLQKMVSVLVAVYDNIAVIVLRMGLQGILCILLKSSFQEGKGQLIHAQDTHHCHNEGFCHKGLNC